MGDDGQPHDDDSSTTSQVDVLVLGAGISGLVSASILLEQQAGDVVVVDEYDHVGGNHMDRTHGGYTFDIGSLIFQDDSPLLRHFPEILDRYVPIEPTWARLNPQGMVTNYPFSVRDDLLAAGPGGVARILLSAAFARLFRRRITNARDFARFWLGDRLLYRSGLENYMERFCGLPAQHIDVKFAEKRMLWIPQYAAIPRLLRRLVTSVIRPEALQATNHQLARSREGFTHLYEPAVRRLSDGGVTFLLGTSAKTLKRVDGDYHLDLGDHVLVAKRVVSTIPLDHALHLCGMSTGKRLPTVTLLSLFFSFSGNRGFDRAILYNFDHHGAWKRLTMYSDFYGRVDGREYFTVEVIADKVHDSVDEGEDDFRRHVRGNGLFDGDLRLEGSHMLPHAYPIYTEGSGDRADASIAALREWGLESFGRQGGFQYQPTARASTIEAEAALDAK